MGKRKIKKIATMLLVLGCSVSAISMNNSISANAKSSYGTKATTSGNSTFAYGWTGYDGATCYVFTHLYDMKSEDTAYGWAQCDQIDVLLKHRTAYSDHYVNGDFITSTSCDS